MRKIWLLLAVFVLATGVFAMTFLVPDSSASAKSLAQNAQATATPKEEPEEETVTDTETMSNTEVMSNTDGMTHTEVMTSAEVMTSVPEMSGPLVATAELQDVDGNMVGTALFTQTVGGAAVDCFLWRRCNGGDRLRPRQIIETRGGEKVRCDKRWFPMGVAGHAESWTCVPGD